MINITAWGGLATNASPYAIPPGAAVTQVNLQSLSPGLLSVRSGLNEVSFTSHSASSDSILAMARYPSSSDIIVYQNESGSIVVATGPS